MKSQRIALNLDPVQQIMDVDDAEVGAIGRWRMCGDDPAFKCAWTGGVIEGGWYEANLEGRVHAGRVTNAFLYPDHGRGYEEIRKVPLGVDAQGGIDISESAVVRFTENVLGLRFDPSVSPCEITLRSLSLRKLSRAEAAWRMLMGVLRRTPGLRSKLAAVGRLMRALPGGFSRMADGLYHAYADQRIVPVNANYAIWLDFYDRLDADRLASARDEAGDLRSPPCISVLVPTYNTPERWLRECLESVLRQVYPHWELCIADDASSQPHVRAVLEEYRGKDPRIRVVYREQNGHISAASNSALKVATGEYVALLDHDDALHPLALLECAKALEAHPQWKMLFTDEDKMDENGCRSDPYFKSDWNPDLFFSQNCVCHLSVYRRDLLEGIGGFRVGTEGAQDWDLTLRVIEKLDPKEIGHVPKVLYHWRMIAGSTALAPGEKSYAHNAALRSLREYFSRNAIPATVQELEGYSGYFKISYDIPDPAPLVSLLIPTRDRVNLLKKCVKSILERTSYENYEILILDNDSKDSRTFEFFAEIERDPRIRIVPWPKPFNYSAINNYGAQFSRGELIGLLNNDVEVIEPQWLTEMVGHALRPEIGVVGAMLYYPDDTIQHAGVVLGIGGVAGHVYVGNSRGYPGHKHRARLAQSLSAVTAACAVMRTSVFREVGGLDEKLVVAFNDIDLCLRVRSKGYRNLWTPFAELYHHESATRGYEDTPDKILRFKREEALMMERWGSALSADPYYNVNFSLSSTPYTLAFPPRKAMEQHRRSE